MINIARLKQIVGDDWVVTKRELMESYLLDESVPAVRPIPAENVVLVKPGTSKEISEIMKLANAEGTPVFVRGGGTGLCGASIPTQNGILIAMERFDKILELDSDNLMMVVEAGVTLEHILKAANAGGFVFPPHPGDEGAQAGGMVVLNAGGTRAVKYGVMRVYVKGLEVVLPTGEIMELGGKLLKNNQGFDLMQLMINSAGLLGIVTKVIFRLYPKPGASATMVVAYDRRYDAINSVPKILQSGVIPLSIEYFERNVIEKAANKLSVKWPVDKGIAYLMVILTASSQDDLYAQAEQVEAVCKKMNAVETVMAERLEEQNQILKLRSELFPTFKDMMADTLDITVPPSRVGELLVKVDEVAAKYSTTIPTYGHAADGNLHAHLMKDLVPRGLVREAKRDIYRATLALGGVITGEHGLGQIRTHDLDLVADKKGWELMWGIKHLFDPNNILNPGVALPEEEK
jgi:glycolate oxidase